MNRIFILTLAVVCLVTGCSRSKPAPSLYTLVLNAARTATPPNFAPGDRGVCIYVNGNPVGLIPRNNAVGIPLNQYLRPGINNIALTDSAKRSWSIAVGYEDKQHKEVLLETNVAVTGVSSFAINLPNVTWSMPIFDSHISDADISPDSIATFLHRLYAFNPGIGDTNKDAVVDLLRADGVEIWQSAAYGVPDKVIADGRTQLLFSLNKIAAFTEIPSAGTIRIIRGPNTILVYTGIGAAGSRMPPQPFLARVRMKDGSGGMTHPAVLYKKNGGWAIWN